MSYVPGKSRIGEPTPQTHPHLFSEDEILAEIKHLTRLDKRHGMHILRAQARLALFAVLAERRANAEEEK